jgi:hypothetical protein
LDTLANFCQVLDIDANEILCIKWIEKLCFSWNSLDKRINFR